MSEAPVPGKTPSKAARALLACVIGLVAFNMRPALTSVGPVLPEALRDTGLSPAGAWLITTVPVLCLGLCGLAAPVFARRLGAERTIVVFLLVLAAGLALRLAGGLSPLVLGCALGGVGIGVANVLVPGVVKRGFPDKVAPMMGFYTMGLSIGAAFAAGVSAPLAKAFSGSWRASLAFWAVPAVVAALAWAGQSRSPALGAAAGPQGRVSLWRDPLAWQVTFFIGLQSALAYSIFAWLAPILRDRGLSPVEAGLVVSVAIMIQAPSALVAPVLAGRLGDHRIAALLAVGFSIAGFAGCLFAPLWGIWFWAVVLAIGQGATFALALTIIVLRAPDPVTTGSLSAMSQGVGYTLASLGPLMMGLLRSWSGGWAAPAAFFFALAVATAASGFLAGRPLFVTARPVPARGEA